MIDHDLTGIWIFDPDAGRTFVDLDGLTEATSGGVHVRHETDDYGEPPYRFRAVKQNGSRLHLRLLAPDGRDARYPADDPYLAGAKIERRAYTSDVRRGIHWRREDAGPVSAL